MPVSGKVNVARAVVGFTLGIPQFLSNNGGFAAVATALPTSVQLTLSTGFRVNRRRAQVALTPDSTDGRRRICYSWSDDFTIQVLITNSSGTLVQNPFSIAIYEISRQAGES